MAYSILGIYNMALGNIGQAKIDSPTENSTPANQANVVWDFVRDEVLESAEWVFAKTRVVLTKNATDPVQGFLYAYTLPPDFLRMCDQKESDQPVYPNGTPAPTYFHGSINERNVKFNYVIETLADATLCLFTDYDNTSVDLVIRYIRREENPVRYSAHFCTTVAFRLAAALAPVLTSVKLNLDEKMLTYYDRALIRAEGLNQSGDYVENETGNNDWVEAGR